MMGSGACFISMSMLLSAEAVIVGIGSRYSKQYKYNENTEDSSSSTLIVKLTVQVFSHTLSVSPDHHQVELAGLIPGGHLGGEAGIQVAISSQMTCVADYLGSEAYFL